MCKYNKFLKEQIVSILKTIYDPEISVDIYELGLIYDIKIISNKKIKIIMTLTTPNCPVIESLPIEVEKKIKLNIKKIDDVKIVLTFDPPWSKEFMSEEARLELGLL